MRILFVKNFRVYFTTRVHSWVGHPRKWFAQRKFCLVNTIQNIISMHKMIGSSKSASLMLVLLLYWVLLCRTEGVLVVIKKNAILLFTCSTSSLFYYIPRSLPFGCSGASMTTSQTLKEIFCLNCTKRHIKKITLIIFKLISLTNKL